MLKYIMFLLLVSCVGAQIIPPATGGGSYTLTTAKIGAAGGVTNNGVKINGEFVYNGADLTIAGTGAVSAVDVTNISRGVVAEWATTGTASKATTVTGAQSNHIEAALTNVTDTTHGQRGGSNLHSLASSSAAGFLSALQYDQTAYMAGRTNVWNSAITTNGGTLTGPLLTTLDHITTPPGDYELPSARWVRGLAMAGSECYFTSTITNGFGNKTTNFALLSGTLPASLFTNSIASPIASSTYFVGGICTNLRTAIRSTITIDAWLARVGGSSASTIPIIGEIYYIYAGTTNHLGDWSVGPLYLTSTTPQNMQWVVSFNEPAVTGAVQIIGYLKTGTVSGPAAGVNIYGGGQYSSHMDVQSSASEYTLTAAGIAAAGGITNNGATINGSPITNGAAITIPGTGGGADEASTNYFRNAVNLTNLTAAGILTNATIKATTFYSATNVTLTLSETCDQWVWTPPTNVPLRITFADLPATSGGSGFFTLSRTNNDNSVAWLNTNITFYSNGTRATNPPTLANYNDFVVIWINGKVRVGLVSTNGVDL
jgi:hypothetical protein